MSESGPGDDLQDGMVSAWMGTSAWTLMKNMNYAIKGEYNGQRGNGGSGYGSKLTF
jgi:hypothetical protein